ncbi:hypothetical protein A3C28_03120 [Candidatus Roizmanbacteria bacterium RIFCSPHIGHO2_02_FULL_39_9]|uniref:ParB-like catalytic effector domain-containing protein n=2 Tax=Candidatus Roizmaniibacteriota TaxID=1752723 RepID=A0A1F7HY82_9BACT|nr:MAG: hypothetical protein A3C28_03120 [Candidatus Roizmanbacteria bacterium RIFCSPHIGHO2_02_FULL_39_9]OGK36061.1 MAG: hypothetical protein A3F60_04065 [Candidatus Roizmanbacteria bacterium RIFCSPHIGHO2_12_FULL_39_8]
MPVPEYTHNSIEASLIEPFTVPERVYDSEAFEVGFARLASAAIQRNEEITYPFEGAHIETRLLTCDDVIPTSFYILRRRFLYQIRLARALEKLGIDLFDLDKIYYLEEGEAIWGLIPGIVQNYNEPEAPFNGQEVHAKQDGLHRSIVRSQMTLQTFRSIVISGAHFTPWSLPYAIPNSWQEIYMYDIVPPVKKKYRYPENPYGIMLPYEALFAEDMRKDPRFHWRDYDTPRKV